MVSGLVASVIWRSNNTKETEQISAIKNNALGWYPEWRVRKAMHRSEKSKRKLMAKANPPSAKASAVPIPQSNSTRKYQIEIGDLQYLHLPLSQSQLSTGMLSRAST
jgi:hypothetical protein